MVSKITGEFLDLMTNVSENMMDSETISEAFLTTLAGLEEEFRNNLRSLSAAISMLLALTAASRSIGSGSGKRKRVAREKEFTKAITEMKSLQRVH